MNIQRQAFTFLFCIASLTHAFAEQVFRRNEQILSFTDSAGARNNCRHLSLVRPCRTFHCPGRERSRRSGGEAVRIVLSPRSYSDYHVSAECISDFNLGAILHEPDVQQALTHPAIRTVMITALDGTSFLSCEIQAFLNPRFYTPGNRSRIVEEYAEFTFALYRTYAGSGKTFLISNWESDNAVYCGSSWQYAHDPEFRRQCDRLYPTLYSGNTRPADSLDALKQWFAARWEGIEEGRSRAARLNLDRVAVYQGPEINSVRGLRDAGFPSVLSDVIPFVPFDFISYSSWESINRREPAAELAMDLKTIRVIAHTPNLILGELGYATRDWGNDTVQKTEDALAAAAESGVPCIFQWVLYEDPANSGFGFFDAFGNPTTLATHYRARLAFRTP